MTEPSGESQGSKKPVLYFLDLNLHNFPIPDFKKGRILAGDSDGRTLRTIVDNQYLPDGICVCESARKIFWTNMGIPSQNDGRILSCNLDGSDIREVVPAEVVHTPKQISVDETNSKLYFADREGMRVLRCNFDGTDVEVLIQNGNWRLDKSDATKWCVGVTASPSTGKFYWTQKGPSKGSQGRIFAANIICPTGQDHSSRTDIECLLQGLPEPIDLEIDELHRTLYWTDRGEIPFGNSLNRVSLSEAKPVPETANNLMISLPGRDYEMLAKGLHEAVGIKIDKKHGHIYAADLGGCVYRFDMQGRDKRKLYEDQGIFTGLTLASL